MVGRLINDGSREVSDGGQGRLCLSEVSDGRQGRLLRLVMVGKGG